MKTPKWTSQDFAFVAKIISEISSEDIRATTCLRFADNLQSTNPKFKWDIFVKACGCQPAMVEVAKALEPEPKDVTDSIIYDGPPRIWTGAELVKEYRKRFGRS